MARQPLNIGEYLAQEAPAEEPPGIPVRPAVLEAAAPVTHRTGPTAARRRSPATGATAARKPRTSEVTESQAPLWQRLERKELRLRADQLDELARLRRMLNRQRGGAGERITENTLIRVAVDLLLGQADQLHGTTEAELRNSVSP